MFDTYSIFIKWSIDCAMKWYHVAGKHGMCHFKLKWHRHTIQNRESSYCICLRVHVCVCVCVHACVREKARPWQKRMRRSLRQSHTRIHTSTFSISEHEWSFSWSQKYENKSKEGKQGCGVEGERGERWGLMPKKTRSALLSCSPCPHEDLG